MAFLHAHAATTASGTGLTVGITVSAVTAGNVVVLGTIRAVNTITDSSVTDNASTPNTYAKSAGPIDNGTTRRVTQWYGIATTGGATIVTLTQSTSGTSVTLACDEFSGNAFTNALVFDKVATNTGSGTALSASIAPTRAGELIVASGSAPGGALAAGTNYVLGSNNGNTSGNWYRLSGTTSETAPATATTSAWVEIVSAFNLINGLTFLDAFNLTSLQTSLWTQSTAGSATFTYASGGAQVNFPAASTSLTNGDLSSVTTKYDLTSSYAHLHVIQVASTATSADNIFQLIKDASNKLVWVEEAGTLFAQTIVAGSKTTLASVSYNSSTHAWWRIRESSGTTFWDISSDGISWTNFTSTANPFVVTALQVDISGSCFQVEVTPGTFAFNNFNVIPSPATPTTFVGWKSLLGVGQI